MNHSRSNTKFGRQKKQRTALLRTLAVSLITYEKIETTLPKAKALRPFVERFLTRAKTGTIAVRRDITAVIGYEPTKKLVETIAPKYKTRNGGYLRITKLNDRKSDGSAMAQIEFV
ncbi:50S ribosomal protein L17 [Candidatus Parcubacteria bacterium]|nr:50S ribosomal protein L17 [Candidatus Parcubacteria bacterium]